MRYSRGGIEREEAVRENVLSLEPKETIIIFAVVDVDEGRQRVHGRISRGAAGCRSSVRDADCLPFQ